MDIKRIKRNEVTSTNTYVKELLAAGVDLPELTLVEADFQTGGRGQTGNSWESERGMNLTFSLLCHPTWLRAADQFVLSQAIAVAVYRVLEENLSLTSHRRSPQLLLFRNCPQGEGTGNQPDETPLLGRGRGRFFSIKWPNDIYWRDRKICGTLIECNLAGATIKDCIIGTGINVNQTEFRSDAPNPVSLAQVIGLTLNRQHILDRVVAEFTSIYEGLRDGGTEALRQEYMQHLYRREGFHRYAEPGGEPFEAEIADVEPAGHLVLRLRNASVRRYEFKEIRYIL